MTYRVVSTVSLSKTSEGSEVSWFWDRVLWVKGGVAWGWGGGRVSARGGRARERGNGWRAADWSEQSSAVIVTSRLFLGVDSRLLSMFLPPGRSPD